MMRPGVIEIPSLSLGERVAEDRVRGHFMPIIAGLGKQNVRDTSEGSQPPVLCRTSDAALRPVLDPRE